MCIVAALCLYVTLISALGLSGLPLNSLCFLMCRNSSLFLLLPVGIVALGVIYVGINDLFGLGYVLYLLGSYGVNGLIAVVERHESRGNSRLVILSLVSSVVSSGGELLLRLGSVSHGLCLGSVVRLNVTVDYLLGSVGISLSRLLCCSVVLDLLLFSRSNRKECLALCLFLSLSLLLVVLLLRCALVSGGRELLLRLGSVSYGLCLGSVVRLNVTVNYLGSLPDGLILQGLLSRELSCLLLAVDECECLALCLLLSLGASSCVVCISILVALGIRNLGSLIIVEGVRLNVSVSGRNDAYCRLFVVAVLRNEQYYLLIVVIVVIGIRAGSGIFSLVSGICLGSILSSLDHDCRLLSLIALSSFELLKSLSLRLVSSKKLCGLLNAGVAPLSLEFLFELLSCLDSKDVVASLLSASCLLSLCLLEKRLCLLDAGINLLSLLGLFKLLCLYSLKLVSLLCRFLFSSSLLALLIRLVLFKKRFSLVLIVSGIGILCLCLFFYKRAVLGHRLKLADVKICAKLSCHEGVLLLVGGHVRLGHSISKVKITVNSVGCGYGISKIEIVIDTAVAY